MDPLNWVDALLIGLLVGAAVWGGSSGFVGQSITFAGLLLGLAAGGAVALWISQRVVDPNVRAAIAIAALFGILGLFYIGAATIAARFKHRVPDGWPRGIDTAGGVVFAMFGVALLAWLVAVPLAESPFSALSRGVKSSFLMRVVRQSPPPPGVVNTFRQALKASGFPTVFEHLPGPLAAGAPPDPTIVTRPEVDQASRSIVKLVSEACSSGSEGTGWVFAPGHIATNAHVVAGSDHPVKVETRTGATYKGTVVAFDPERDVAVVRVPNLPLPPVPWTTSEAPTDLSVAALGYPENGPFVITPGRVRQLLTAKGRDIYDTSLVDRRIYEVATRIRPGNSGGPLMSPRGTVFGIVFAASSTDDDIGYALSGAEIQPVLDAAAAATGKTDTGHCVK